MRRRSMNRLIRLCFLLLLALAPAGLGLAADRPDDLYRVQAIVTGKGEKNRQLGFRDCLDKVLVRASGDQRLLARPEIPTLRERAGDLVASFTYRDRLEGVPIHDEQGSYDRPHDLTCVFDKPKLDAFLGDLGSAPWLERPRMVAVVGIHDMNGRDSVLASDSTGARDTDMRTSLMASAERLALPLLLPTQEELGLFTPDMISTADPALLGRIAKAAGGDVLLIGTIVWRDKGPPGWVASWRIAGQGAGWGISGVGFDDAFRNGVGGAAQVLSGHEVPGSHRP